MNLEDLVNEATQLTEKIHQRGAILDWVKKIYVESGFEKKPRWDLLQRQLPQGGEEQLKDIIERLKTKYSQECFFNDKFISVFKLNNIRLEESVDLNTAVLIKSIEFIAANNDTDYKIQEVDLKKEGFRLFTFNKVKKFSKRDELTKSDIYAADTTAALVFDKYNRVVGYKDIEIPCYDIVLFDVLNNIVVVGVDLVSQMTDIYRTRYTVEFFDFLSERVSCCRLFDLKRATDLHGFMRKFYEDDRGAVKELSFSTSQLNNTETIKSSEIDIRKSPYHLAGISAEEHISIYGVIKAFDNVADKHYAAIGLMLGYRRFIKGIDKSIPQASFKNITGKAQFFTLLNEILS